MEIPLLGFGLMAAVWCLILIQRSGALGLGIITLIAGTCFGSFFLSVSVITSDRMLVGVLCVLYMFFCSEKWFRCKRLSNLDYVGAAFLAWLFVSTLSHNWKLEEAQPLKTFLFYFAIPGVMYWMARETRLTESSTKNTFIALSIFGVYLALTAVAEWRQIYAVVFPRYIVSTEHIEFLGRGRGPLLNPSGNGILLCLCLGCVTCLWPHFRNTQTFQRSTVMTGFAVIFIGAFATLTRCVWLGALGGVLLMILAMLPKQWKYFIIIGGVLFMGLVMLVNKERLNNFKRDKGVSASDMSKSASLRPMLANVAVRIFKDYPIRGVGLGQYKEHRDNYHTRETDFARPYVQHNIFLSILTENGLVGLVLFIALLARWARTAWLLWGSKWAPLPMRQLGLIFGVLLIAYIANGMFQDVTIVPMVHTVLAYFAGLVAGQYLEHATAQPFPSDSVQWNQPYQAPAL